MDRGSETQHISEKLHLKRTGLTLTKYIVALNLSEGPPSKDYTQLIFSIMTGVRCVSNLVNRGGQLEPFRKSAKKNSKRDLVQFADQIFKNVIITSYSAAVVASEHNQTLTFLNYAGANQMVAFKPLDTDTMDPMTVAGTIWTIFEKPEGVDILTESDFINNCNSILNAGYAFYGAATSLVMATEDEVLGFNLDPTVGDFMYETYHQLAAVGNMYSINEALSMSWEAPVTKYVENKKDIRINYGRPYDFRYQGCLVADVNMVFCMAGMYLDTCTLMDPHGKINLMFEGIPLAYIAGKANGRASNGNYDILKIAPSNLNHKLELFIGSRSEVAELLRIVREERQADNEQDAASREHIV